MTDPTPQQLAHEFLAGVMDHDFDRMRAALSPDATWSVPGTTPIAGTAYGADAVVERARAVAAGGVSIELQHVLTGWEDRTAVLLHNTGRRGDTVLDEQVVIVFTTAGGRITAAENLISDVPMLDAFFHAG